MSLTFAVPIALIFIFGQVFGGSDGPQKLRIGFINKSTSEIARKIESTLDTTKTFTLVKKYRNSDNEEFFFDTNTIKNAVLNGKFTAALVIPEDVYTDTSNALKLKFFYDPKNDLETQIIQGVLQQTIMQCIPDLLPQSMQRQSEKVLGKEKGGRFNTEIAGLISNYYGVDTSRILNPSYKDSKSKSDTGTKGSGFNFFDNILNLEKMQLVGKEITNPMATRNVGGWAMMFLMFTITASASSLFDEKKSGVVLRLLTSPISRTQILWSKYIFNMSLGILQLTFLFITGNILFNIDIFSNFFNLLLVVIAASTACTGFGMLISSFSKTASQANGFGTFLILTMSAIGGAWFPVSFMPGYIQFFSKLTLVYWSVEGFIAVLWRNAGFIEILPYLGVLLLIALIVNIISFFNFRKGRVF